MILRVAPWPTVAGEALELFSFTHRSIPARPNSSCERRGNKARAVSRSTISGSATVQVSPLVLMVPGLRSARS
jgi:hypothetical protein